VPVSECFVGVAYAFLLKNIGVFLFLTGAENSQVPLKANGDEVTCYPQDDTESFAELGSFTYLKF